MNSFAYLLQVPSVPQVIKGLMTSLSQVQRAELAELWSERQQGASGVIASKCLQARIALLQRWLGAPGIIL